MASKEHITAEWARKTAETQLGVEAKKQFETCLKCIEEEVKKNHFSATVYFPANKHCIEELKKRGFKAQTFSDQRDGDFTNITW